jgi:Uma2 family endonuclease
MTELTPVAPNEPARMTVERYFGLVQAGVLSEDDDVELLEGVIVAMTPSNPPHAAAVTMVTRALFRAVGERASVRTQCALVLTPYSCPEPDVAVVSGSDRDYISAHPTSALLVVEVADASLQQDRITKAAIYAAAGVPDYWIVNLRNGTVEVMRNPDPAQARYHEARTIRTGERLVLAAIPGAVVAVDELLPVDDPRR